MHELGIFGHFWPVRIVTVKLFSDGKLSLDVFGVFLCQIIDQIYAFPGITETRILKQFDYVCPRTSLLDFLARLELTGIIIKQRVKYQEPRLVSKFFPEISIGTIFSEKKFETY